MTSRVRLIDIAAACGVSKGAVVRALNRPPETCELRPQTRERIRAMAVRMGYRPDWRARALNGQATNIIALLYVGIYPPMGGYPARLMGALARRLAEHGRGLLLIRCMEEAGWRELFAERRVDGAVVIDTPPPGLLEAGALPVPVVLLNHAGPLSIPQVLPDDRQGAFDAAMRLVTLGHRQIAYVAHVKPSGHVSHHARHDGYLAAMRQAGLTAQVLIGGEACAAALDQRVRRPSAVIAYDDILALAVLRAAQVRGLHIPGDLSIIGINDSDVAQSSVPPLSSVSLPGDPLSYAAADLLLSLIDGAEPPRASVLLPEYLVERASMGPRY